MVEYKYNAWGKCKVLNPDGTENTTETFIGNVNPFRYRGYYFDTNTGLYYLKSRFYDPETGRFLNADTIDYLEPDTVNGLNLYAYCGNNPIMNVDPSGHFWDYIFDAVFIVWSVVDLFNGGYKKWENWVALGVDVIFAVLPFFPSGAGQIIKVGNKIDNVVDVANTINKIDNIHDASKITVVGRSMNRVQGTADLIGKTDNLYDMWKGFDSIKDFNKPLGYALSGIDNGFWMFSKLRSGYIVIDIGITTTHKGVGLYYGVERFVITVWKTRNFWKLPINAILD